MAGGRAFRVLFRPDAHVALSSWSWTQHHLLLATLYDVQSRLEMLTPKDGEWERLPMTATPALSTINVVDTDPDRGDEYWFTVAGFLTPSVLQRGDLGEGNAEALKHQPDFFGAAWYDVSQHFAVSKDGTRIPYFQIAPRGVRLDGSNRTLLYGYGGFEMSQQPYYSGSVGRAWLQRGGVYVVANIRGGGEYGPAWHQAALRTDRHRSYEDFAAVARDLVKRGVTTPRHLGAEGSSNGGLLMGNMLVQYPELFGAIACEFPLLDMKRYTHLAAGASWMAEYGDPDTADWTFIRDFSPYSNLRPDGRYPPVLFYTSTNDDRVSPAHARKMVARMEAMGLKNAWFYENIEGGHGAGVDDKQDATMHALTYDFLWSQLQ
jgi:prolyl oligopeptidase